MPTKDDSPTQTDNAVNERLVGNSMEIESVMISCESSAKRSDTMKKSNRNDLATMKKPKIGQYVKVEPTYCMCSEEATVDSIDDSTTKNKHIDREKIIKDVTVNMGKIPKGTKKGDATIVVVPQLKASLAKPQIESYHSLEYKATLKYVLGEESISEPNMEHFTASVCNDEIGASPTPLVNHFSGNINILNSAILSLFPLIGAHKLQDQSSQHQTTPNKTATIDERTCIDASTFKVVPLSTFNEDLIDRQNVSSDYFIEQNERNDFLLTEETIHFTEQSDKNSGCAIEIIVSFNYKHFIA